MATPPISYDYLTMSKPTMESRHEVGPGGCSRRTRRSRWRPAGSALVARDDPGEVPVALSDPAAGVGRAAGARAVAVGGPEGQPGQVVLLGVGQDRLEVGDRHRLTDIGDAVHRRDPGVPVGLVVGVAVGVLDGVLEPFGGLDGQGAHVLAGGPEVE